MIRSEAIPADAFPRELLPGVGDHAQIRCLSERSGRSVHLVDDGSGSLRVFKIHRLPSEKDLERFERVRSRLSGGPPCPRLLPVLDHGAAPCLGIAWEELALADSSDPGHRTLQDYSPETLRDHEMIGRAPSRAVAAIGLDLLGAMEHLGGVGLVHGDIKPSNIFRLRGAWVLGDLDSVAPAIESTVPSNLSTEGYRPPAEAPVPSAMPMRWERCSMRCGPETTGSSSPTCPCASCRSVDGRRGTGCSMTSSTRSARRSGCIG